MANIITLSLNPAIDVTLWVDDFINGQENRVHREHYEAAGKAVNVSKALSAFNVPNHAVIMAGKGNLMRYEQNLREEGLDYEIIPVEGYTRQNISVINEKSGATTRLLCEGFTVPYEAVESLLSVISRTVTPDTIAVISGRLPSGVSSTVLRRICSAISERCGRIALDCTGVTRMDMAAICPWVIKPNRSELCALINRPVSTVEAIVAASRELIADGVEQCLVSCDCDGIVYVSKDKIYQVEVPSVDVASSVGAGDSALAGFIMAFANGQDIVYCAKTAASFGTAACMTLGSQPPTRIAAANLLARVTARELML